MSQRVIPKETFRRLGEYHPHQIITDIQQLVPVHLLSRVEESTPRIVDNYELRQFFWGSEQPGQNFDLLCLTFSATSLTIGISHRHDIQPERFSLIAQPAGVALYKEADATGLQVEAGDEYEQFFREKLSHVIGRLGLKQTEHSLRVAS